MVPGEALAYWAPAPPSSSPNHGSALLPTDVQAELLGSATDARAAANRRRLIFVLRVVPIT